MHMRQHRDGPRSLSAATAAHPNDQTPPQPSAIVASTPLALTPVGNKQYQCPVCLKCYSSTAYLAKHVEGHGIADAVVQLKRMRHQERMQQRQERDERLSANRRASQAASSRRQSANIRPIVAAPTVKCPLCPVLVAGGPVQLLLHIGRDHKVSNSLKCWECDAIFSESSEFMLHLREHTEQQVQSI